MRANMKTEPVAIINTVTAAIEAIILAVVAFGVDLSPDQIGALMGAVIAVGAVVQTTLARSRVSSPATVDALPKLPLARHANTQSQSE